RRGVRVAPNRDRLAVLEHVAVHVGGLVTVRDLPAVTGRPGTHEVGVAVARTAVLVLVRQVGAGLAHAEPTLHRAVGEPGALAVVRDGPVDAGHAHLRQAPGLDDVAEERTFLLRVVHQVEPPADLRGLRDQPDRDVHAGRVHVGHQAGRHKVLAGPKVRAVHAAVL